MQKISQIFSNNKHASIESKNYPINLIFSVNKNFIYFWPVIFFLNVSHNISQNMRYWKEDLQKAKASFFFERARMLFCVFPEFSQKNYFSEDFQTPAWYLQAFLTIFQKQPWRSLSFGETTNSGQQLSLKEDPPMTISLLQQFSW